MYTLEIDPDTGELSEESLRGAAKYALEAGIHMNVPEREPMDPRFTEASRALCESAITSSFRDGIELDLSVTVVSEHETTKVADVSAEQGRYQESVDIFAAAVAGVRDLPAMQLHLSVDPEGQDTHQDYHLDFHLLSSTGEVGDSLKRLTLPLPEEARQRAIKSLRTS